MYVFTCCVLIGVVLCLFCLLSSFAAGADICVGVLQKYIERPLLYDGRKFDVRCYCLVTHDHRIYFYEEGYLRTSTHAFTMDACPDVADRLIHLTNNAVQKKSDSYGQHEQGNQVSFEEWQQHITVSLQDHIMPQFRKLAWHSMQSVKRTLNPNKHAYCFELFGLDFMLNADYQSWLIEANTNPCLALSSPLLKRLLPRMINDVLRITVDPLYPPPKSVRKSFAPNGFHLLSEKDA